jgi:predicted Zn-dependent protease
MSQRRYFELIEFMLDVCHLLYAAAYLDTRAGHFLSAQQYLQRLLAQQPQHSEAQRLLGYVQQQQRR